MAGMTRIVRDLIIGAFEHEKEKGWLHNWLAAFREVLLPDLDEKQFADMFAQTLAYGLFAAKVHSGAGKAFSREMAAFNLPKTNPFLRKLFSEIAGVDMPDTIDWAVDDIVELLKHADLGEILKDFGKGEGKKDPVVHFYETFLAAYDPKMRELRGVYYTPEAVVSYIVRSIDHLLKTRFNRPKGLADENTLILDPACGTGTFLYFVIQQIYQKFAAQKGAWDGYVAQHLLNRLFGFELLMAPYAVAHLKLGMELQETGYSFGSDQRLGIYLTNTLEEAAKKSEKLFAQWISDEANAAASIKRDLPIMVVMGNPPYSGHSANRSWEMDNRGKKVPNFIGRLLQDYYKVDGQPLGERNPKWLQDDYVKFLRFGQWRIERTGAGVLAFITNHGYLDNPTFRGMRQQLMNAFTDIYILNLHGNAKKKERAPDGSKDENVFDIQQGVAIGIFVKAPSVAAVSPPPSSRRSESAATATVHHADLWGLRKGKYAQLFETDLAGSQWTELEPAPPFYLFVPQDTGLREEYERGWKVTRIFTVNSVGFQTHRDYLVISPSRAELLQRMTDFANPAYSDEEIRRRYFSHIQAGKYPAGDTRDWKLSSSRRALESVAELSSWMTPCIRRPFDFQFYFFHPAAIEYGRPSVMDSLIGHDNKALLWTRPMSPNYEFSVLTAACAADQSVVGNKVAGAGGTYVGPLYRYGNDVQEKSGQAPLQVQPSPWPSGPGGRRPNLNPEFIADLEKRLRMKFVPEGAVIGRGGPLRPSRREHHEGAPLQFGPEDVFNYIYAIFHSPTYRSRYAEFLKIDFPRVPLTSDVNLFRALCEKGAELVALHLLESPRLENPITGYPVKGSNVVEKGFPKYVAPGEPEPGTGKPLKAGRVYINAVAPVYGRRGPGVILSASEESRHFEMKKTLRSAQGDKPLQKDSGQYFEGVPPEVWQFHLGGYQVCEKWLKDRRGRTLGYDDLEHYRKVVTALKETIRLMAEIDAAIPKWPIE
jgi:hypothetical protein